MAGGSPADLGANYASENNPQGVAIDPAAGKIYWASGGLSGAIRVGNLDGSGSPTDLYTHERGPVGVAIDPAAGKIYWADSGGSGTIRVGNLDGSGSPADLGANYAGVGCPEGVAIDPAAGKIYWADFCSGAILVGNLDGSGSPADLGANYAGEDSPTGVAIDPAAGKIYWTNAGFNSFSTAIRVGNLDGSGSPANLGANYASESFPEFLALVRAPAGTGAPVVSGGVSLGSVLSCSQGQWAENLLGAFLYRAPRGFAYQWQRNGADIAAATSTTYTPTSPGDYSCRVTASNQAGSASQTSAPRTVAAASPTLATNASPGVIVGAGSVHDTATVAGGSSPTGQITFTLYGPDDSDCSGTAAFTDTEAVAGNGDYQSADFTPAKPGTYRWIASYGGDANNNAAATACNEGSESVTVTAPAVMKLSLAPKSFTADPTPTPLGPPTPKRASGTEIHVSLSAAALVHFSIRHVPRRPNPSGPKVPHAFNRSLGAGKQSIHFTGTLDHHTLHPGDYMLYARAIDTATGYRSPKVSAKFTVLGG